AGYLAARVAGGPGGDVLDRRVGHVHDDVVERVETGRIVDEAADRGRPSAGARLRLAPRELAVVLKALEIFAIEPAGRGVARRDARAARSNRAAAQAASAGRARRTGRARACARSARPAA